MNFPFDKTPRFVPQGMIILDHWISYYSVKILSQLASVLKLLFSSVHVKNKKTAPKIYSTDQKSYNSIFIKIENVALYLECQNFNYSLSLSILSRLIYSKYDSIFFCFFVF